MEACPLTLGSKHIIKRLFSEKKRYWEQKNLENDFFFLKTKVIFGYEDQSDKLFLV